MTIWRMPSVKTEMGRRSHASVYNDIRSGLCTKPVPLGLRSVGWPDYEITAITNARIAGQTDEQIKELVSRLHAKRIELVTA